MSEYYKYDSYEEYIKTQRNKAQLTKARTSRRHGVRRRKYIYKRMMQLGITGTNILCLGARDDSEIDFFSDRGYKVDGIDLYSTDKIIECDMSRMYEHPYLKDKKYDIVYSNEVMEHCMDLEGFIRGLNLVCNKYFVCMCPIGNVTIWDCARHSFMYNEDDLEENKRGLEEAFPEFEVVINEIHKEGYRMFFILKKRDE